ncbi:hypothetical protein [Solidesulfovibrio sp.]
MPKERPILMSGGMIRAILADIKRKTRRVIKPQPVFDMPGFPGAWAWHKSGSVWQSGLPPIFRCPYGQPGDRLWIRETWGGDDICGVAFKADHPEWPRFQGHGEQPDSPWRPSIHMPRWASRLTLDITAIGQERLQDISEADAKAEGAVDWFWGLDGNQQRDVFCNASVPLNAAKEEPSARDCFIMLWDSLNFKRAPWKSNPWVWVVEFKSAI